VTKKLALAVSVCTCPHTCFVLFGDSWKKWLLHYVLKTTWHPWTEDEVQQFGDCLEGGDTPVAAAEDQGHLQCSGLLPTGITHRSPPGARLPGGRFLAATCRDLGGARIVGRRLSPATPKLAPEQGPWRRKMKEDVGCRGMVECACEDRLPWS
jgi:hypothetical protein